MTAKAKKSLEELSALWAAPAGESSCSNPACPNLHRINIAAESITITNLIVAGELPPEMKQALAARMAA
ncbi:MAG TPA: hypothetical protein VGE36_13580 [Roseateles sp.]